MWVIAHKGMALMGMLPKYKFKEEFGVSDVQLLIYMAITFIFLLNVHTIGLIFKAWL
jgi:hypothetical protein